MVMMVVEMMMVTMMVMEMVMTMMMVMMMTIRRWCLGFSPSRESRALASKLSSQQQVFLLLSSQYQIFDSFFYGFHSTPPTGWSDQAALDNGWRWWWQWFRSSCLWRPLDDGYVNKKDDIYDNHDNDKDDIDVDNHNDPTQVALDDLTAAQEAANRAHEAAAAALSNVNQVDQDGFHDLGLWLLLGIWWWCSPMLTGLIRMVFVIMVISNLMIMLQKRLWPVWTRLCCQCWWSGLLMIWVVANAGILGTFGPPQLQLQ